MGKEKPAWSKEDTQELLLKYPRKTTDIQELAEYFGKSPRSVISKLVYLGAYITPDKKQKRGLSVKEMIRYLEVALDIHIEDSNLNKKNNLKIVVDAVKEKIDC